MESKHLISLLLVVVVILAAGLVGMVVRGPVVETQQEYMTQFESVMVPTTETVVVTSVETSATTVTSGVPQTTGGTYFCTGGICNWYYWFSGYIGQSGQCVGQVAPCITPCLVFTTSNGIYYLDNLPTRYTSGYVTIYGYVEPGPYQGCAGWYLVIYVQSIS